MDKWMEPPGDAVSPVKFSTACAFVYKAAAMPRAIRDLLKLILLLQMFNCIVVLSLSFFDWQA